MATNPYVNRVQFGNNVLIDLTGDSVTADTLGAGATAHDRSGAPITGTATVVSPTGDVEARSFTVVDAQGNPLATWDNTGISEMAVTDESVGDNAILYKSGKQCTIVFSGGSTYSLPFGWTKVFEVPSDKTADMFPVAVVMLGSSAGQPGLARISQGVNVEIFNPTGSTLTAVWGTLIYYTA